MRTYTVNYRMIQFGDEKSVDIVASNAPEAYTKAMYEVVPQMEGEHPYSVWVARVHYINGKAKDFNTCEGFPY